MQHWEKSVQVQIRGGCQNSFFLAEFCRSMNISIWLAAALSIKWGKSHDLETCLRLIFLSDLKEVGASLYFHFGAPLRVSQRQVGVSTSVLSFPRFNSNKEMR